MSFEKLVIFMCLFVLMTIQVNAADAEHLEPYSASEYKWILGDQVDSDEWSKSTTLIFEIDFIDHGDDWSYTFSQSSAWNASGGFVPIQDIWGAQAAFGRTFTTEDTITISGKREAGTNLKIYRETMQGYTDYEAELWLFIWGIPEYPLEETTTIRRNTTWEKIYAVSSTI